MSRLALFALGVVLISPSASRAAEDMTLTVKDMHICCGACVKGIEKAIDGVEGASVEVAAKDKQIVLSATDAKTARKALNALAKAGFHGATGNKKFEMKDLSEASDGIVRRAEIAGIHNCCGACTKAIKESLATVGGIEADTLKPRAKSFVVEGEFDLAKLVKSLNKSGFHIKVKASE